MINKLKLKIQKGFTLVETLAAIMLLSIAIVGPMTIAQKGLSTALISKDQDSAFYLAQDAIEFIRYARDTNCLVYAANNPNTSANPTASACTNGTQWLAGGNTGQISLSNCLSANGCMIDTIANTAPVACSGTCSAINYDPTLNQFNYTSGTASTFTRTVKITYNHSCSGTCNPDEADIAVTVSWTDPIAHTITVNDSVYDWQ